MNQELKNKFESVCDELQSSGYNVVAAAIKYEKDDAYFSTKLSLTAMPEFGVTEDHIVLDAIREITHEWSESAHRSSTNG